MKEKEGDKHESNREEDKEVIKKRKRRLRCCY
jgi:hypothetical protein